MRLDLRWNGRAWSINASQASYFGVLTVVCERLRAPMSTRTMLNFAAAVALLLTAVSDKRTGALLLTGQLPLQGLHFVAALAECEGSHLPFIVLRKLDLGVHRFQEEACLRLWKQRQGGLVRSLGHQPVALQRDDDAERGRQLVGAYILLQNVRRDRNFLPFRRQDDFFSVKERHESPGNLIWCASIEIAQHDDGELAIGIVGQLGVEPLDATAVLDDRVPVRRPHSEAVAIIVLERCGHFLQ